MIAWCHRANRCAVLLLTVSIVGSTPASPLPEHGSLWVRCGRLIDGVDATPRSDVAIRIENGVIVAISPAGEPPAGIAALDLGGLSCLPGLLDLHTHLTDDPESTADLRVYLSRSVDDAVAIGRKNARATLEAGFTTVRDVGTYVGWSDRVGALLPGRYGDLIAVAGDPLTDVRRLEEVRVVVNGGVVVKGGGG